MESKVILYIFAGRQSFMRILLRYVDVLLESGILSDVHIWDYTRSQQDKKYITETCNSSDKYTLKTPTQNQKHWDESYHYYRDTLHDSDLVIKCDDDIVYIDLETFSDWIDCIKDGKFYYPNIVNNDVCAYFQQKHGIHDLFDYNINYNQLKDESNPAPMTGTGADAWYRNSEKAEQIHELFLKDRQKFTIRNTKHENYDSRISINMFGCTGLTFKKFLSQNHFGRDDEAIVSAKCGAGNIINLNTTIVHYSFFSQHKLHSNTSILNKYDTLSKSLTKIMQNYLNL